MSIKTVNTDFSGEIGVVPRLIRIATTDTYATITSANYLKSAESAGYTFYPNDVALVSYGTNSGTSGIFLVSISGSTITLVPYAGSLTPPTVGNDYIPVVTSDGEITIFSPTDLYIALGSIHAGASGTAGNLACYAATESTGLFGLTCTANAGDYNIRITNASHGQASTYTIPDGGSVTGKIPCIPGSLVDGNFIKASGTAGVLADAGARIISGVTGTYAGGGTSNAFSVTGLTASAHGSAVIRTSTNNVSITKAVPGTNTLTITFSGDPGANTTVDYIYTTAAMT